MLFEKLASLH